MLEALLEDLGDYELIARCGQGANALVFRARQRSLEREVALKVLQPQRGEAEGVAAARFLREARLAAQLRHPNAVQIIETREHRGLAIVVMEWLQGHDLRRELALNAPLQPTVAAALTLDIAAALCAAHRAGIIHRDLKPANVMIVPRDEERCAVVIDFGLARTAAAPDEASLTCEDTMLGTPSYMSPETIRGDHTRSSSDIYSLGVVFLEMLTGENPWRTASALETVSRHLDPGVHREAVELLREQPAPLVSLITSMLAPDDRQRPDARGVVEALRSYLAGASAPQQLKPSANTSPPVTAPETRGPLQPPARRPWTSVMSVAARPLALLGGATLVIAIFGAATRGARVNENAVGDKHLGAPQTTLVASARAVESEPPHASPASQLGSDWLWLDPRRVLPHDLTIHHPENSGLQMMRSQPATTNEPHDMPSRPGPPEGDASSRESGEATRSEQAAGPRSQQAAASPNEPASPGSLTIVPATPGELLVDGVSYGRRSALILPEIASGAHRVELRHAAGRSTRAVHVRPGRRATLRIGNGEPSDASSLAPE